MSDNRTFLIYLEEEIEKGKCVHYFWKYSESIEESQLEKEGVYGERNRPNGPKCILSISKAHERAHGQSAMCNWTMLGESHLK